MMGKARPRRGDLLIMQVAHSQAPFLVGADLDHPQLSCTTYEEAVRRAVFTAQRASVDVWSTEDRVMFECVAHYREEK